MSSLLLQDTSKLRLRGLQYLINGHSNILDKVKIQILNVTYEYSLINPGLFCLSRKGILNIRRYETDDNRQEKGLVKWMTEEQDSHFNMSILNNEHRALMTAEKVYPGY